LSRDWLRQRERANAASLRLLVRIALLLGRPAGRMLLFPVCLYFVVFSVRARAASRQYLRKVLGRPPGSADLFRHSYSFATVAWITYPLPAFRAVQIRVRGEDALTEAQARGESCFLLGAHLGSFEALHAYGEENGIKTTMMMFEHGSRNMNALARAVNPGLERTVVGMGSLDSMMKLRERLESGEWVGMLGRGLRSDGGIDPRSGSPPCSGGRWCCIALRAVTTIARRADAQRSI
jgi:predicted LPLAT superfamily acyltransferase